MSSVGSRAIDSMDVAQLAQLACILEASAPKPGNVSPGRPFADLRYEDFIASAIAIGRAFEDAGTQSIGETVRRAMRSTLEWAPSNTNLGIVLLLAPLARAVIGVGGHFSRTPADCPRKMTSDPNYASAVCSAAWRSHAAR